MRYGSSGAIFCCLTLMIGASGCSDGENKKRVNESCSDNTDCADDICHKGICADPNPADNGQPCTGKGNCRSYSCSNQLCIPGATHAGSSCLYNQECASLSCITGTCVGGSSPDAGPDGPLPDSSRQDLTPPDFPVPDMPDPDQAAPDMLLPDQAQPDMPPPDQAAPDQEPPDQALPDMPLPDQALPDMPLPDQEPPDQALPDMPVPDLLQPDKLQPDILSPDLFPQVKVLNPLGFRIDKTSKVHPTLMNPALAKGGTATSSPGTMAPPKVRASMAGWSPCPAP